MRKIAISMIKAGVGKTTTACHLAHGLALEGLKVLLVDTAVVDQCSSSLGVRPRVGLADLILGHAGPREALTEARDRLFILSGGTGMSGIKKRLSRVGPVGIRVFRKALKPVENHFDAVLLDTSPQWSIITGAALFYAKEVLAPFALEGQSVLSLYEFKKKVDTMKQHHPDLALKYVLPTFLDEHDKNGEKILEQVSPFFENNMCEAIRRSIRLSECAGYGETVFEYAPTSTGTQDYRSLVQRIMEDNKGKTS